MSTRISLDGWRIADDKQADGLDADSTSVDSQQNVRASRTERPGHVRTAAVHVVEVAEDWKNLGGAGVLQRSEVEEVHHIPFKRIALHVFLYLYWYFIQNIVTSIFKLHLNKLQHM